MVDSHFHLSLIPKKAKEVLESAFSSGVKMLVDVCLSEDDLKKSVESEKWFKGEFFRAFGLYPDRARDYRGDLGLLEKAVKSFGVSAIGEIGIDLYHDYGSAEVQQKLFEDQIKFADEFGLPIIVHSRDAFRETLSSLKRVRLKAGGVMHCFGYGPDEAKAFLGLGFFISFAGNITYKRAHNLQNALKVVPHDKLLIETDSPYLSPVPLRGKFPNEPANIVHTYSFISELLNLSFEELEGITEKNTKNFLDFNDH